MTLLPSTIHASSGQPDAPISTTQSTTAAGLAAPSPASPAELSHLEVKLRRALPQFPDFPSPGILFEDILPIFADPDLHESLLRALEIRVRTAYGEHDTPDVIVALEARGFLFGPGLALRLGAGFVPVRKPKKLPHLVEFWEYELEYGMDRLEIHRDAVEPGQQVLIVDDVLATGGTASAVARLVERLGGRIAGFQFLIELDFLNGRKPLTERLGYDIHTVLHY